MGKNFKRLLKHMFVPHKGNAYRPHALRHKALSIYSVGLILSQLMLGATMYSGPDVLQKDLESMKKNIVVLSNAERANNHLSVLSENEALDLAAQKKLNDMFTNNYWDHTGPKGETAWDFISGSGYQYLLAGENLARGFSNSNDAVKAWMNSPTHRANILNNRYKEIGIAAGTGKINGNVTTVIVQLFGEPKTSIASESAGPQVLGESKLIPEVSLKNASVPSKTPYLLLWMVIFGLVIVDGFMIRRLGLHASRSHVFNLRVSLFLSFLALAVLSIGVVGIA
uniref:CAP domain-containing protein n=1 Tax=candidate division WWE3 bacterium TaxID=2053526 RepID=A0A7C4XI66_UNCKA